nr:RNA-directed DNA polymerase (reverse transcriptase) and Integrase domain containing protein [Haemonchus contortus]
MRLDTGADVTLLSHKDWIAVGRPKLLPPLFKLKSANNKEINVRGYFKCKFAIDGRQGSGTCHVADTTSLLGLDWIAQVEPLFERLIGSIRCSTMSDSTLATVRSSLTTRLRKQFPAVFAPGLGCCTKTKASLKLKPDATPVFRKARPVPYAVQPRISQEIDRLVAGKVLTPVEHSDWAAPVVVVQKKNGSIRLCTDFSTGLNDALEQHQHPLPAPDDIFAKLNGGKYFSQLDLAEAYLQIEMDEESRQLLTINTHRGLYRLNRLPFGVKAAPAIFQQQMDTLTAGLEGAAAYLDDIIVTGKTIEEHNSRLEAVFRRIQDFGFRLRLEKCSLLRTEIRYLGFIIDDEVQRPDPTKIEAIQKMPIPEDVSQLRAFLGLVNFYGTFVRELHNLRAPLDALTKKDAAFAWSPECQSCFDRIKKTLKSDLLLAHYDPTLPLIVAADASNYGIGAVLSQRFPDGHEKAVYHASRALTPTQKKYSQIEKEALAIIFAVQKFHRFIHGRHFTLRTDHKPLISIFGTRKGVPVYTANRLQRWATTLLNYNFSIQYVKTSEFGQADALSRLIGLQSPEPEDRAIASVDADLCAEVMDNCHRLPVSFSSVQAATTADHTLIQVIGYIRSGKWPKVNRESPFWPYYNRRESLSTIGSCLLTSNRLVIPKSLQRRVLQALHKAHPGQTRMKMLARSYVYWPSMEADIEKLVRNCATCAQQAKDPVKTELQSWPKPLTPWTRVHADFAGPLDGNFYLVIVDAFSKWPEIIQMNSMTTSATIKVLTKVFAQFGNPHTLVTDNGTQFTSATFVDFCRRRGIKHVRSPPFHPQSNGQAERFVDTFKRGLAKLKGEEPTTEALQAFLMAYRSTPCPSGPNHLSPAENFLGRRIRTELDLMMPSPEDSTGRRDTKMEDQFNRHQGAKPRHFDVDDAVYAKDYRQAKTTWTPGIIARRLGNVMYHVRCGSSLWTRHANQLRPRDSQPVVSQLLDAFDTLPLYKEADARDHPTPVNGTTSTPPNPTTPDHGDAQRSTPSSTPRLRRSLRTRHSLRRLMVDPKKKSYSS